MADDLTADDVRQIEYALPQDRRSFRGLRAKIERAADLMDQGWRLTPSPQSGTVAELDLIVFLEWLDSTRQVTGWGDPNATHEDTAREYLAQAPPSGNVTVNPEVGVGLIAAERQRQVEQERWSPEHDAKHAGEELALAAAVYALPPDRRGRRAVPHPGNNGDRGDAWRFVPSDWPWDPEWYKPTPGHRVRELVKAGALIAAEIDRLQARSAALADADRDH